MKESNKPFIVSLDFDGTLVRTDNYPFFDPNPLPGCLETLMWMENNLGAKFILLTQRDNSHVIALGRALKINRLTENNKTVLQDALDWCQKNKINLWGINENPTQHNWSTSRKVYSDLIIDDHCAGIPMTDYNCVDWIKLGELIKEKYGQRK